MFAERPGDTVRSLLNDGKVAEALRELPALEAQARTDPEAKFALGEILQELAALRANDLARAAPDSVAAHELLGRSLEARGKLPEALAEYRAALNQGGPLVPGLQFLIGNVQWKLRDLDAAQAVLAEELKANPHHAAANLRMGEIVLSTDRDHPLRAVAYLEEAVKGVPDSLEAHRELGKALRLTHRYPEAIKHLQFVATKAPGDDSVHAQLAALYRDTGNAPKAAEEMRIHGKILRDKLEASRAVSR